MNDILHKATEAIKEIYNADIEEFRGEMTLILPADNLAAAVKTLKEQFDFNILLDITAVDYWPQEEPRFHVIYQLYSMSRNLLLRLRVPLGSNALNLDTIEGIFANANWKEREVWDMFGINFEGHSDLRRILMPADWEGHPLRKDYPLGCEEIQFTFNFKEIDLRKPHSKGLR